MIPQERFSLINPVIVAALFNFRNFAYGLDICLLKSRYFTMLLEKKTVRTLGNFSTWLFADSLLVLHLP